MSKLLQKYDEINLYPHLISSKYVPETYIIDLNSSFISEEERIFLEKNHKGKWIFKSSTGYGGFEIKLIDQIDIFK